MTVVRFGEFELDLTSGELWKGAERLLLPDQPFRILSILVQQPGAVVTRDTLRRELWSDETFVDFEHSLNAAVKRLREALGDSAASPRFIETIPRRGYRFIAAVYPAHRSPKGPSRSAERTARRRSATRIAAAVIAALGVAGLVTLLWRSRSPQSSPSALGNARIVRLTSLPGLNISR